ncbi:hypothetical protein ACSBR1_036061 [Camellia fascicularis]
MGSISTIFSNLAEAPVEEEEKEEDHRRQWGFAAVAVAICAGGGGLQCGKYVNSCSGGLIKGSGGQERDATLNQLLVCLDGFEGRGEVITIASTNRPDILDPALVRPGQFDRKIYIPKPGVIGRMEILKVHAHKKPMAEDVDYMAVANMTDGMVGAELANIIEIAAINMMRNGRIEGKLTDGSVFDSSFERGDPIEFELGSGQVIKGWDQGLLGMCIGENRKLKIPTKLGYGEQRSPPTIPGNNLLVVLFFLQTSCWGKR